jgi:hypothetical protein
MIRTTFGLTTGNFVKLLILVAFIFFFIRMVYLAISLVKGDGKAELKKLFGVTEFILWSLVALWVFYTVPSGKLLLAGVLVVFLALDTAIWFGVRQRFAGIVYNRVFDTISNKTLKIDNEIYQLKTMFQSDFDAQKNDKIVKFNYLKAIKLGTEAPISTNFELNSEKNSNFETPTQLKNTIIENNFISKETFVEITESNKNKLLWNVKITSFEKDKAEELEEFIKHII